ncbi:MAG: AarF/UbiB family protein [Chthoniobacterales bacterium]
MRNGRQVAVKVQRPQIRERMVEDSSALGNMQPTLITAA